MVTCRRVNMLQIRARACAGVPSLPKKPLDEIATFL